MPVFYTQDKKELIDRIKLTTRLKIFFIMIFLILTPFIVFFLKLGEKNFSRMTIVLLLWLVSVLFFERLIRPKRLTSRIIGNFYFLFSLWESFLFVLLIYFLGGIGWIGFFYASVFLVFAFLCLEPKRAFIFSLWIIFLVGVLFFLEWQKYIPHQKFFDFDLSSDIAYLITTFIGFSGFVLVVAFNLNNFSMALNKKNEEIINIYKKIEDLKNALEIRVEARKRELQELVGSLDLEVKRKKKELQQKIDELEKENKKIIERELEIIKIKKEIKELKEKLK